MKILAERIDVFSFSAKLIFFSKHTLISTRNLCFWLACTKVQEALLQSPRRCSNVKVFGESFYKSISLNIWMDLVDTMPVVRY